MERVMLENLVNGEEKFYIEKKVIDIVDCQPLHDHDHTELFWVEKGKGFHCVNDKKVPLEKGAIVFIRPSDQHSVTPANNTQILLRTLSFFKETADYFRTRYFPKSRKYFWSEEKTPFHDSLDEDLLEWLNTRFEILYHKPSTNFYLDQFLLSLLEMLGQNDPLLEKKDIPAWLFNVLNQYKTPEHFARGPEGFAAMANRSVEHVSRTIKKHFDMSLSEVINRERMNYAARQLIITDDPIFSIAMDCNFANHGYFYTLFKDYFKITPGEYRELYRRFS